MLRLTDDRHSSAGRNFKRIPVTCSSFVTRGAKSTGHAQQPNEPDCRRPTAPPPPADTPHATIPVGTRHVQNTTHLVCCYCCCSLQVPEDATCAVKYRYNTYKQVCSEHLAITLLQPLAANQWPWPLNVASATPQDSAEKRSWSKLLQAAPCCTHTKADAVLHRKCTSEHTNGGLHEQRPWCRYWY
jgi:hypothetical protein